MLDSAREYMGKVLLSAPYRSIRRKISGIRMHRMDSGSIPDAPDEIRLFLTARNESLRLPYFFKHYRSIGVDRFFVIDNNSTDDTESLLLSQEDTHVFHTKESFRMESIWKDFLLHRYGMGHWCVIVDADELLAYPHRDTLELRGLCEYLDQEDYTAMHCMLLDVYSDKPFRLTEYERGGDPLLAVPYFDPELPHKIEYEYVNCSNSIGFLYKGGGMRERVFGSQVVNSKFPLVKFQPQTYLTWGFHRISGSSMADVQGVLFHTKFLFDFNSRVLLEAEREQHWDKAHDYKSFREKIVDDQDLTAYYPKSVRYADDRQLVELGVMKTSEAFEAFVKDKAD
jgi:hypothetical protein